MPDCRGRSWSHSPRTENTQRKGRPALELLAWDSQPGARGHYELGLICQWTTNVPYFYNCKWHPRFPSGDVHSPAEETGGDSPVCLWLAHFWKLVIPRSDTASHVGPVGWLPHGYAALCGCSFTFPIWTAPQHTHTHTHTHTQTHNCPSNCCRRQGGRHHLSIKGKQTVFRGEVAFFRTHRTQRGWMRLGPPGGASVGCSAVPICSQASRSSGLRLAGVL